MSRRLSSPIPFVRTGTITSLAISVVPVLRELGAERRLAHEPFVRARFVLRFADDEIEHLHSARVADPARVVRIAHVARAGRLASGVLFDFPRAAGRDGLRQRLDVRGAGADRLDHRIDALAREIVDELEVYLRAG